MARELRLRQASGEEGALAMSFIDAAKAHLKSQGIDQWQKGYPDRAVIDADIVAGKGFFLTEEGKTIGYLCVDFDGEPAYDHLSGEWATGENYVVLHRMAFSDEARGRGLAVPAFRLVEDYAYRRGITAFRVDTDAANGKMRHILEKCGFRYRGTIWFDNSEKIAFDKEIVR